MSRYGQFARSSLSNNPDPSHKHDRNDERSSTSGSDDGSIYAVYSDTQKADNNDDEDANAQLTSQTLNADGTPKRPMNAFMIFARRRRPQVSAENQSMRTGEISKILSKEWNAMQASEKQFYLDQAKLLKESFNSRYPDYVYRRRPNNSRKRRRTETSGSRPVDASLPSDHDDLPGMGDLGESSPTDGEDSSQPDSVSDAHLSRLSHDTSQSYDEHGNARARTSAYAYPPSEGSYRHPGSHENRIPYMSSDFDRNFPNTVTSMNSSRLSQSNQMTYPYPSHSQSPSSLYNIDHRDNNWESRADQGRPNWPGSSNDRQSISALTGQKSHPYPGLSQQTSSWPSHASTGPGQSQGNASTGYGMPTLSSPFYPTQAATLPGVNYSSSPASSNPSQSASPPAQYTHSSSQFSPSGGGRSYDHRGYAASPSMSPANFPTTSNRDTAQYHQPRHSASGMARALPPMQSMSGYQSINHDTSPPPATAPPMSQMGYWSRDKLDGR